MAISPLGSISGKLVTVFALILPILVWQLGKDTVRSIGSYHDISVLDCQNAAANSLIAGVYELLLERLDANNALLSEQPAGSDSFGAIEKLRSGASTKIAAAVADLSVQEFPNKTAIAAAVEEQSATTSEISRNVLQAAEGTQQVSSNVVNVRRWPTETATASARVLSAARAAASESKCLKFEVGNFLDTVRAA